MPTSARIANNVIEVDVIEDGVLEVLELYIVHEVLNLEDFVLVLEDIVLHIDNIGYVVLVLEHLFIV